MMVSRCRSLLLKVTQNAMKLDVMNHRLTWTNSSSVG